MAMNSTWSGKTGETSKPGATNRFPNPHITVIRVHRAKREPESFLTLLGGRHVPRVSIIVEYELNAKFDGKKSDGETSSTLSPT